ncbi:MAG TPA: class I tRNA ligase family protein, partial [Actinomycetota bacterium]|nr:class I tRNA ligase family protein [Actinomycetota bacterium]
MTAADGELRFDPIVLDGPPDGAVPLELGRRVALYVCGITPYDTAHLGHAFTYVAFDTLVRFLRRRGHEVDYCQNVTDVDDDVLARAARNGEDYLALGRRETAAFLEVMDALNVARPTWSPRATEEIGPMVDLAARLVGEGHAYEVDGTVF